MSKNEPNQPGFVLPTNAPPPVGHQYPPPPAYSQQQQAYYPPQPSNYPQQQPIFQNQPFPGPIQHQPAHHQQPQNMNSWYANRNFQDYLRYATSFHVKQKVELLEAIVGWETPNKYTVKDQAGHKVFYVGEESGCLSRQCWASIRPFTMTVKDSLGNNVLVFDRGLNCTCCFGCCCPDSLTVSTSNGQLLGSVKEEFSILYPRFKLKDAHGNTILKIEGPFCPMSLGRCGSVVFKVMNKNGVSVGTISKEWSGLVRELFTDADFFSMSFPIDLDPTMKAVCLGALFLIDFEYFERNAGGGQGGRRLFG